MSQHIPTLPTKAVMFARDPPMVSRETTNVGHVVVSFKTANRHDYVEACNTVINMLIQFHNQHGDIRDEVEKLMGCPENSRSTSDDSLENILDKLRKLDLLALEAQTFMRQTSHALDDDRTVMSIRAFSHDPKYTDAMVPVFAEHDAQVGRDFITVSGPLNTWLKVPLSSSPTSSAEYTDRVVDVPSVKSVEESMEEIYQHDKTNFDTLMERLPQAPQ